MLHNVYFIKITNASKGEIIPLNDNKREWLLYLSYTKTQDNHEVAILSPTPERGSHEWDQTTITQQMTAHLLA